MVELDGLIYVLGGENEVSELMTVELFDPHFNSWKMQTSMTMIRKVNKLASFFVFVDALNYHLLHESVWRDVELEFAPNWQLPE